MSDLAKINILGTDYIIKEETEKTNSKMVDLDGLCERFSKEIIIDLSGKSDKLASNNIEEYFHEVLRHECFHAIFHEAGHHDFSCNENLVDALAMLWPKIRDIMDAVDSIKL